MLDSLLLAALTPLLPELVVELSLGDASAGVLLAGFGAGMLLAAIPSGLIVGRIGARATTVAALLLQGAASALFGLAGSFELLLLARVLEGAGSALAWTAILAWLVGASVPDQRGRLVGLAMGAGFAGITIGPAVGALAAGVGIAVVFVPLAALCVVVAAVLLRVEGVERTPNRLGGYLRLARRVDASAALWFLALPGLTGAIAAIVISLRLDDLGASATAIGVVFVVSAAFQGALTPWLGHRVDRLGPERPLRISLVATAAIALLAAAADERLAFACLAALLWFAVSTPFVPGLAMLARSVDRDTGDHAIGFALMNLAWAPANVVGSIAGGALRGSVGDEAALALVAVLALASIPLIAVGARDASPAPARP